MKKLEFRPDRSLPVHRLPFVRLRKKSVCYWSVPRAGGYSGGCATGRALALVYLRFRSENRQDITFLQYIVLDMFGMQSVKKAASGYKSLKGQMVGFFSEIDRFIHASVSEKANYLDRLDDRNLLKSANMGLKGCGRKCFFQETGKTVAIKPCFLIGGCVRLWIHPPGILIRPYQNGQDRGRQISCLI